MGRDIPWLIGWIIPPAFIPSGRQIVSHIPTRDVLPELLRQFQPYRVENGVLGRRCACTLQLGCAEHFRCNVTRRWISQDGPIAKIPTKITDPMKSLIYVCPIETIMDIVHRIAVVDGDIWKIPSDFDDVYHSLSRRCESCITAGGISFEQFVWACTSTLSMYITVNKMFLKVSALILVLIL